MIVLYGGELAEGFFPSLKQELPIFIQIEKLIVASMGVWLLKCYGRRYLTQIGLLLIFISLIGLTSGFWMNEDVQWSKNLIFASFFVYIIAFVVTYGPIMWLYIPEIVQPNFVPYVITCHWATCCTVITLFPIVRSACGDLNCPWIFLFFTVCVGVCMLVVHKMMVETKDKP